MEMCFYVGGGRLENYLIIEGKMSTRKEPSKLFETDAKMT